MASKNDNTTQSGLVASVVVVFGAQLKNGKKLIMVAYDKSRFTKKSVSFSEKLQRIYSIYSKWGFILQKLWREIVFIQWKMVLQNCNIE